MAQARILVVEHDLNVADYVVEVVRHGGWDAVGPAHSLLSALELIAHEPINGAVIDLRPESDAMSIPVASLLSSRKIPFVFITGGSESFARSRFDRVAVVTKPFVPETLIGELHKLLP